MQLREEHCSLNKDHLKVHCNKFCSSSCYDLEVTSFQTFQGILLKRIWGGWFLPIFFFTSQIEQIKQLSTQYSLAMMHGATTDSKQQDHSLWLETAKLQKKMNSPSS